MPYKSSRIKIEGTQYDRRRKLSEEDKENIRRIRKEDGFSYNRLAKMFGISKRLAMFICCPEKEQIAREQFKERRKDGRYAPTREERNEILKEHRHYKQQLYLEGKI